MNVDRLAKLEKSFHRTASRMRSAARTPVWAHFCANGKGDRCYRLIRNLGSRQLTVLAMAMTLFILALGPVDRIQAEEPVVKVVRLANGEWPPYAGQRLPEYGCDSQVVTEAFALSGIRVEYTFLPWARGKLLSNNGLIDGTLEWEDTPAHRSGHFVSSMPLSTQEWVFFHRKGSPVNWQQLEDLQQQRIGLTIGYVYGDVFKSMQARYPATFVEAASDVLNFRKLINRRLDLFPMERAVGNYLLKTNFTVEEQASLTRHPKPIAEFTPHLLLSRAVAGNEQRMQLFEQGLQRLQAGNRYREIMAPCSSENP